MGVLSYNALHTWPGVFHHPEEVFRMLSVTSSWFDPFFLCRRRRVSVLSDDCVEKGRLMVIVADWLCSGHFHSIIITIIICPSSLISSGCGQVSGWKTAKHGRVLIRRTHLEWSVVPASLILSDIIIESWATKSPSLRAQNELVSVSSTYNIPTVDGHCCSSSYIMHNYRHSLYANK